MALPRRQFIRLAGGGIVLAAGGAAAFVATRTPERALDPWRDAAADHDADPRRFALAHAILAPNPHNRQPWIADIRTPGEVTLRVDRTRLLPQTDPFNRQITIGLGCFLELMVIAAAERGQRVDLTLFPDGEDACGLTDGRVAIARFRADAAVTRDPLFAHILARRSNKAPFDTTRPLAPGMLAPILASARHGPAVGGSVDTRSIARLRELTVRALRIEVATPRTYRESVDLFRIGRAEIERNPDGIDFSGPLFESLALVGQFNRKTLADTSSSAYSQGMQAVLANPATAMGHVWMVSRTNTRVDQIAAGRDWVRLNLAATRDGIAIHPLSQALQEFPEMADPHRALHALLAPGGGTVQMLARIGHGPVVPPSPRWPLAAKLVRA